MCYVLHYVVTLAFFCTSGLPKIDILALHMGLQAIKLDQLDDNLKVRSCCIKLIERENKSKYFNIIMNCTI